MKGFISLVLMCFSNDKEQFIRLTSAQTVFSVKVDIKYEHFADVDMDELLKTAGTCSQDLHVIDRGSKPS